MMDLMKFKWAMVPALPLKIRASLNSFLILFYVLFYMFLKLPRIYFLFKSSVLIIMFMWNFTHLFFFFFFKDRISDKILHHGLSRHGLYHRFSPTAAPPSIFSRSCTTFVDWHARLGHPADCIVCHVLSKFGSFFSLGPLGSFFSASSGSATFVLSSIFQ
jgi:hypothetical protein